MSVAGYETKVPEKVRAENLEKQQDLQTKIAAFDRGLQTLKEIKS